jgi:hypothetical protein
LRSLGTTTKHRINQPPSVHVEATAFETLVGPSLDEVAPKLPHRR